MIEIYGKPDCPYCVKAKQLCEGYNLAYNYHEVGKELTREELLEQFPNARTVPQIVVGGNKIGGYDEFVTYIEETGYNGTGLTL